MFWFVMYLLARQRPRVPVSGFRRRHPRFWNPWYYVFGVYLAEGLFWETLGALLALWWLAWLAARYVAKRTDLHGGVPRWIETSRPVWPKRKAVA